MFSTSVFTSIYSSVTKLVNTILILTQSGTSGLWGKGMK